MYQRHVPKPPTVDVDKHDFYPWRYSLAKITNYGFFLAISAACLVGHGVALKEYHKTWYGVQGFFGAAFIAWTWKYYRIYAHNHSLEIKPHATLTGAFAYGAMTLAFMLAHYFLFARKKKKSVSFTAQDPVERVVDHS
eukprot:jgi/Mesvir1/23354/Mv21049-RA.1